MDADASVRDDCGAECGAYKGRRQKRGDIRTGQLLRAGLHGVHELLNVEWLDEDAADFLEASVVGFPRKRRSDDCLADQQRIRLCQMLEDIEAVRVRHHQIEHDGGVAISVEALDCFEAVAGLHHAKAFSLEHFGFKRSYVIVVVDDEDRRCHRG